MLPNTRVQLFNKIDHIQVNLETKVVQRNMINSVIVYYCAPGIGNRPLWG